MKGLTLWNEFSVCIRMNKWHLTPVFYILEYVNALTVCRTGVFRWEYFYMYEQLYSEKSAIEWMKGKYYISKCIFLNMKTILHRKKWEGMNKRNFFFQVAASIDTENQNWEVHSVNQPFFSISVNFRINLFIMVHSAAEKKQKKKVKIPSERTLLAQICNSIQNWIHFWSQHFCRNAVVFNSQFLGD